jgi:urea transport system substrate-binding protein
VAPLPLLALAVASLVAKPPRLEGICLPKRLHSLGLLFSATGSYGEMATASLDGVMLAIGQINSDEGIAIHLDPVVADPGGDLRQYGVLANALLEREIRHVIGCYTSLILVARR